MQDYFFVEYVYKGSNYFYYSDLKENIGKNIKVDDFFFYYNDEKSFYYIIDSEDIENNPTLYMGYL